MLYSCEKDTGNITNQVSFEVKNVQFIKSTKQVELILKSNKKQAITFEIYDILGNALMRREFIAQATEQMISCNANSLAPGIYYTRITNDSIKKMTQFNIP